MMRLLRLRTERFGSLPDRLWEFGEGLQLIQGPNEAGKSSLQQALTWVLYGDASSTQQSYASRRRWGETDHFALELALAIEGGEYRLVRDFQGRHNRLFRPDGTRISSKEQIRQWVADTVKLPTEASFLATACICQDELSVDARGSNIQSLLEQHVLSGSGTNVDLLVRKLKARVETLRRGLDHPAKNLGPIKACEEQMRRIAEELGKLRGQQSEGERASDELERVRTTLEQDVRAIEDARAYLVHDGMLREARRRGEEAAQRLKRVQEQQRRLADLQRELPERAQAADALRGALVQLQDRLTRAREAERLAQRLAELSQEVGGLEQDLGGLDRCHAELAQWQAQMAQLPLREEEIQSGLQLPQEIQSLQEELDRFAQRRDQLRQAIAQGDAESETSSRSLQALQETRRGLEDQLTRAREAAEVERQREALRGACAQKRAFLGQIEALRQELAQLDGALEATSLLDGVNDARLAEIPGQISQLELLLGADAFEVILEPLRPIDVRAEADGLSAEHAALAAPLRLQVRRGLELELRDVARVHVSNRSQANLQLNRLQEELARLLAHSHSASVAEYHSRRRERDQLLQRRASLREHLARLLQGASLAQLREALHALEEELRGLEEAAPGADGGLPLPSPQALEQELRQGLAREGEARDRFNRATARGEVLRQQLQSASTGESLQVEVQRKRDVLHGLLHRAEATQVEALLPLRQRWEECRQAEQQLRVDEARWLSGRREADIRARMTRLRREADELRHTLARLGDARCTGAELDALEAEHARVAREHEGLDSRLKTVRAEILALSAEPLEEEHTRHLLDLAKAELDQDTHLPFALTPEERLRYERRVKELEAAVNAGSVQLGHLQEQTRRADDLVSRIAELEETLEELSRQRDHLRRRASVDEQVRVFLETARKQAIAEIYERLPGAVATRVERMTRGAHRQVQGEGLDLALWSARKGGLLGEKELSRGTRDQFYLSLRLTLLDLLFSHSRPPLLLDDPLVHCDPDRRREILALLADYAEAGQVLLFTCHAFPEYDAFPVMRLE